MSADLPKEEREARKNSESIERQNDLIGFLVLEYLSRCYGVSRSKLTWFLFGMESLGPDRLSEDDKQRLSKLAIDYASLTKQLQAKIAIVNQADGLSDTEKAAETKRILNEAKGSIGVAPNEDVIDSFAKGSFDFYRTQAKLEMKEYPYLSNTQFSRYCSAIETIIRHLYEADSQNIMFLTQILRDPSRYEDTLIFLSTSIRLEDDYKYLARIAEPMTLEAVSKLIAVCHDLSNIFAMQVRDLMALLCLTKGMKRSYQEIEEHGLAINLSELKEATYPFRVLIRPFNKTIRNAIAHITYRPDYVEKKITFIDRKRKHVIGYDEFTAANRELSAAVLALLYFGLIVTSYYCLGLKEMMKG